MMLSVNPSCDVFAVDQLDKRDDFVAPPGAGPTRHHDVVDRGMLGDRRLDLFGEDLLAAGIDGDRIAAQQFDLAVGIPASPVPRNGMPDPIDDRERARRLRPDRRGTPVGSGPAGPASRSRRRPGDRIRVMSSLTTTAPGFGAKRPLAFCERPENWPI